MAADRGKRISVRVSADGGTTATSGAVKVKPGTLKAAPPKIAGTAHVGRTLTAKPGSWTAGTTLTYRWRANGNAVKGAAGRTLKVGAALRGKRVTVTVSGSKPGYRSAARTSAAVVVR